MLIFELKSNNTHTFIQQQSMEALYFRFVELTQEIDIYMAICSQINSSTLLLLNEIAIRYFEDKKITITQAMFLKNIASPSCIQRQIVDLINAGLIEYFFENGNRRAKFLVPTKLTCDYFDKMSEAIVKANTV